MITRAGAVPPPPEESADASGGIDKLPAAIEKLLGGAAVVSAALYVLINGLYVEFYESFGVRPEDVGWDKLTVLARSTWLALALIPAVALIVNFVLIDRNRTDIERFLSYHNYASNDDLRRTLEDRDSKALRRKLRGRRRTAVTATALAFVIIVSFVVAKWRVDADIDAIRRGENVDGVRLAVPIIDVQANWAAITWLGDPDVRPTDLTLAPGQNPRQSPTYLTFLGKGRDVAVFLQCGETTVILPAKDVQVTILSTRSGELSADQMSQMTAHCDG